METLVILRYAVLSIVLLVALYTDVTRRTIYNWLTFPAIGLGIGFTLGEVLLFHSMAALQGFLLGVFISAVVFGIPTWLGWLGGGDFKLVMAVATLLAGRQILEVLFCISLVGAVMACIQLIMKGSVAQGFVGVFRLILNPRSSSITANTDMTIPYGIAISVGTLLPIAYWFITSG